MNIAHRLNVPLQLFIDFVNFLFIMNEPDK